MLSSDEKQKLETEFNKFDQTKTGVVSDREFYDTIKGSKPLMNHKEIKKMAKELDFDDDSNINYTDFIIAVMDTKKLLTKERLKTIFHKFDTDLDGKITQDNMLEAMESFGYPLTESQAADLIRR